MCILQFVESRRRQSYNNRSYAVATNVIRDGAAHQSGSRGDLSDKSGCCRPPRGGPHRSISARVTGDDEDDVVAAAVDSVGRVAAEGGLVLAVRAGRDAERVV